MPYYHKLGTIPHKRHTQFRKPDGGLYSEELFSTEGFSNDYSLLYHIHPPTQIIKTEKPVDVSPKIAEERMLSHRSFEGFNIKPAKDFWKAAYRFWSITIVILCWQHHRKVSTVISIRMQMPMK